MSDHDKRNRAGDRVTWLSVWLDGALVLGKIVVGVWGQSRALVADGLHSLTDLATDIAVLVGMRIASAPPDDNHPYGHQKVLSIVTLLIAGSIVLFCGGLIVESLRALVGEKSVVPDWPTLAVAIGAIGVKEFLYRRTRRVALKTQSRMLMANAWNHRTDAVSSGIAALGIGLAIVLGPAWALLDAVVGIALGGYLFIEGSRMVWGAVQDLMDSAPGREIVDDLREHILPIGGAESYHDFRARRVGDAIEIDFHLLVDPSLSLQEAHEVARQVKAAIMAHHPEVLHVLIHIEPALPEHAKARGIADGYEPLICDRPH